MVLGKVSIKNRESSKIGLTSGQEFLRLEPMNREAILKRTASYEDNLLERLKNPELAQAYLKPAIGSFEREGSTEALLLAMRYDTLRVKRSKL